MEGVLIQEPRGRPRLPPARPLPPWRLCRVLSGHTGWVRSVAVDPANTYLATGSADRTVKLWSLAADSKLLLTLTGHVATVRSVAPSPRHPYLFSSGDDRQVKCWDLETNSVVRHYHGHLHAVYQVRVHPQLDVVATASRDGTAKLWDMRTRSCIHTLTGHQDAVFDVQLNDCRPQVVTGSADRTVRLWDIVAGRTMAVLTQHKKGVRALAFAPHEHTLVSAGERLRRWALPRGRFLHSFDQSSSGEDERTWSCVSVNYEGITVAGSDDGTLSFWDHQSGACINSIRAPVQPGSLECEAGVLACTFDASGLLVFTGDVDKTVKVYKEAEAAE